MNALPILMNGFFQPPQLTHEEAWTLAGTAIRPDGLKVSCVERVPRPGKFSVVSTCILFFCLLLAAACVDREDLAAAEPLHAQQRSQSAGESTRGSKKVLLDLSRKETFVLLSVNANPRDVLITDVEVRELPTSYRLAPASGSARLGHPLDIQLEEPGNVRIRLAVVKRGKGLALKVSPQVVLGPNNAIDLTQDRITRTARNLRRRVKHLNQQLVALAYERRALNVWLLAPGNKPLAAVKTAHFRMKMLDQAIRARKRDVPAVQSQCAALGQVAEFVKKLHQNVEIRYAVKVTASEDRRRGEVEWRSNDAGTPQQEPRLPAATHLARCHGTRSFDMQCGEALAVRAGPSRVTSDCFRENGRSSPAIPACRQSPSNNSCQPTGRTAPIPLFDCDRPAGVRSETATVRGRLVNGYVARFQSGN